MTARYVPGTWPAIVGPRAVLLLGAPADSGSVQKLWAAMEAGGDLDRVLAALLLTPLSELPSFALAVHEGDAVHVLVRGTGSARAHDDEAQEVVAGSALTWRETTYSQDACVTLHLGAGDQGATPFPAAQGIVLAQRIDFSAGESRPDAAPQVAVPEQTSAPDLPTNAPAPVDVRDLTLIPEPHPAVEEPGEAVSGAGRYDHMFRPQGAAAAAEPVAAQQPEPEPDPEPEPEPEQPSAPVASEPVADVRPAAALPAASGLIDGVPWLAGGPKHSPAPALVSAAVTTVGDPEPPMEATTRRSDHQRLLTQLRAESDRVGPLVHAVTCVRGHLNDPQRERCRMCAEALVDQEPVTVPRPVLGQLRLSTGDVVALDRSVLLGRNPKIINDGGERPHLVKVGQGQSDVSRTHVSVTLDGWHVLVEDLRSTNGTEVTLPGRAPQRLREGQPLLLEPGADVVLAEGVSFRYEVAP